VVLEHQRERVLVAAAEGIAERGYCELTVRDVIAGAGVSRRTFYELFDDKLECVIAAHALALGRFERTVRAACRAHDDWPPAVAAAVDAGLEFVAANPAEARLILLACHTVSEPRLMDATRMAHRKLVTLLCQGRERCAGRREPLELTESALVGALTTIVGERLCDGDAEGVRMLAPQLVQMILAPYVGRAEAARVAQAA
jgi:AcrR family transcriptional regulator